MADPFTAALIGTAIAQTVGGVIGANTEAKAATREFELQKSQIELERSREETQAAIEAAERERELRSTLGRQRALFGAAGIEGSTGTAQKLGEVAIGTLNRQSRFAELQTGLALSQLNIEEAQAEGVRAAKKSAARAKRTGAIIKGVSSIAGTMDGAPKGGTT